MRIIRPQQLAVLKSGYQLGKASHMGISVVAGVYLSRPNHLITEAQIWQAWKAAPISFRVLDSAEPKPYAEFLLAGHAGIGEAVSALDVMARVGPLERRWRVEGESGKAGMRVKPFTRMPLDHTQSWGGPGCKDNPLGRGHDDNRHPTLMAIGLDGSPVVRSSLASPGPLPPDFQLRKNYLDAVAPEMSDKHYLETCFPGLPASINRRYFQMAAPSQWLKQPQWPETVPFELRGFRPDDGVLRGEFPALQARAFAWGHDDSGPQEIVMQRKTLWLLPDNDVGLMVFTGHVPLKHLFDEPLAALLVGLDAAASPRDEAHYADVYARRSQADTPSFEFMNDPDLMPLNMPLNVIRDLTDHPDSQRYGGRPLKETDVSLFYQDVNEAIRRYQQQPAPEAESGVDLPVADVDDGVLAPVVSDAGADWLREGSDAAQNLSFTSTDFVSQTLRNKHFSYCTFSHSDFSHARLESCTFEQCRFIACTFTNTTLDAVTVQGGFMRHSRFQAARFERGRWEKVNVESCGFQLSQLLACSWQHNVIMKADFSHCRLEACAFNNGFFSDSVFTASAFQNAHIGSCVFEKCTVRGVVMTDCTLVKNSLVGGDWQESRFSACRFDSITTGLGIDLSGVCFEQCSMSKIGFTRAVLCDSRFQGCTMLESNCDKANLDSAVIQACDMAGLRLKDALLTRSQWRSTSLQQSMLYNADLRDATFTQCNFAGANLALINQNVLTRYERCLMEQTHWLPRRYRAAS